MLLLLRRPSGHSWPLVYCSFRTFLSHVGPDSTWPRLTYSSPNFTQDAALEGHFHEPMTKSAEGQLWTFIRYIVKDVKMDNSFKFSFKCSLATWILINQSWMLQYYCLLNWIKNTSAQAWTLTSLLHQRPADVDVKSVLLVFSRGLHLPVCRVHSQRWEVVRVALTITEDTTHIKRVNTL